MKVFQYLSNEALTVSVDDKCVLSCLQRRLLTQKHFSARFEQEGLHFWGPSKLYGNIFQTRWCLISRGVAEIITQEDGRNYISIKASFRWKFLAWQIIAGYGTLCLIMFLVGTQLTDVETPYRTPLYFFMFLGLSGIIANYVGMRFIVSRTVKKAIADARGSNTHQP